MKMKKVLKKFKNKNISYHLGYSLSGKKVELCIEIYKDEKLLSVCDWTGEQTFNFNIYYSSSHYFGYVNTIKELFIKLKEYNEIPDNIEREYENMFLLYKLNDFKEFKD